MKSLMSLIFIASLFGMSEASACRINEPQIRDRMTIVGIQYASETLFKPSFSLTGVEAPRLSLEFDEENDLIPPCPIKFTLDLGLQYNGCEQIAMRVIREFGKEDKIIYLGALPCNGDVVDVPLMPSKNQ